MKADDILKEVSHILRISLFIAAGGALVRGNWVVLFTVGLALGLTFLPRLIKSQYRIVLPEELELVIVLVIYASLFLGEIHGYYTLFWWWDIVLHAGSGLALGYIGFLSMFILYENKKVAASPRGIALFSFCFALAIGALWEIAEFSMDLTFGASLKGYPMQPGLVDTMKDLIVDAAGALIASISGFFYLKGKTYVFRSLVNRFAQKNPKLIK